MSEEQEQEQREIDIKQRMDIKFSVVLYLKSEKRFDEASREFRVRLKQLQEKLQPGDRFVVKVEWTYYLVETNSSGQIQIDEVEVF